jgi:sugar lactone lactonase YvrE
LEWDSNGRLWVGTDQPGIDVFERADWIHGTFINDCDDAFIANTIALGTQGRVWVGTQACGLFVLTVKDAEVKVSHVYQIGNPSGFPSNFVSSITTQGDSLLWVGTESGLCRLSLDANLNATHCQAIHLDSLGLSDFVHTVVLDKAGNLWVGTESGLGKYNGKDWALYRSELPYLKVNALAADSTGAIWIGTNRGITRLFNDQWTTFATVDGLPDNKITAIATDPEGVVWCGTPSGVASFDGIWTQFTTADGLSDNFITDIAFGPHQVVWFSTWGGGLSRYYKTGISPETQIFTHFDITSGNTVTFQFSGFDLNTATEKLRYSYKLDNSSWSKYTSDTFVSLQLEQEGRHTFYVRAIDNDGNIDPSPALHRFTKINATTGGHAVISDPQRKVRLYFPPSVLPDETALFISFIEAPEHVRRKPDFTGIAYRIIPESSVSIPAHRPITLTLLYPDSIASGSDESLLSLYRYDESWQNRYRIGGTVDVHGDSITTAISEFGSFVLFIDRSQQGAIAQSILTNLTAEPRIFSPKGGFDEKITIAFDLSNASEVTIKVYNPAGRLVKVLRENTLFSRGRNAIDWNGRDYYGTICPSGLYIICVEIGGKVETKPVMVLN